MQVRVFATSAALMIAAVAAHAESSVGNDGVDAYITRMLELRARHRESDLRRQAEDCERDTALIGAAHDSHTPGFNTDAGSAYVFRLDHEASEWIQVAKLTASDAAPFDELGNAVSLSDDVAIVAARSDDDAGDSPAPCMSIGSRPVGGQT